MAPYRGHGLRPFPLPFASLQGFERTNRLSSNLVVHCATGVVVPGRQQLPPAGQPNLTPGRATNGPHQEYTRRCLTHVCPSASASIALTTPSPLHTTLRTVHRYRSDPFRQATSRVTHQTHVNFTRMRHHSNQQHRAHTTLVPRTNSASASRRSWSYAHVRTVALLECIVSPTANKATGHPRRKQITSAAHATGWAGTHMLLSMSAVELHDPCAVQWYTLDPYRPDATAVLALHT